MNAAQEVKLFKFQKQKKTVQNNQECLEYKIKGLCLK